MSTISKTHRGYTQLIVGVSIIIPIAVALLLFLPYKINLPVSIVAFLPGFNAGINSLTALLLLSALWAIKQKNIELHKNLMLSAFILGAIFLLSYVTYHSSTESTIFGDINHNGVLEADEKAELGISRVVYLFVLLSHILLAIIVLPFVLFALFNALTDRIERHKKIVKFAFPIWLYVSVSGVIVFLMIRPYYPF
jgi:putative membrane protein